LGFADWDLKSALLHMCVFKRLDLMGVAGAMICSFMLVDLFGLEKA